MKKHRIIELSTMILGLCILLLFNPLHTNAAEEVVSFTLGENTYQLSDTKTMNVVNGEMTSTLTILEQNEVLFEKELTGIKVANLENLILDNSEYVIISYRYDGSSNALVFEVIKLGEKGVTSIFTSDIYSNARYQIKGNQIIVEFPEQVPNGIKTEPDKLVSQTFVIESDNVAASTKKVQEPVIEPPQTKLNATNGTNPPISEISQILTEEALKAGIAPEILKAIAFQESGWQQYWDSVPDRIKQCPNYDGTNVKLGYDCIGIGIMQISNQMYMPEGPAKEEYIRKIKTDIRFNIQEGIKILKDKWNYSKAGTIPTVNDNDPMVIENWYFAILAYNGLLPRNNPIDNAFSAYQEQVLKKIEDYSLLDLNPFPTYKLNPYKLSNGQLRFDNTKVIVEGSQNYSSHTLKAGDIGYITENRVNYRSSAGGTVRGTLNKGTKVTITGNFVGNTSKTNHYVWLPIKTDSGITGYVASSYVRPSEYIDVYPLYGHSRYDTAVSVANHGWHLDQPNTVVIANGVVPVDALTGSVLASSLNAPILLSQKDALIDSTIKELNRLKPSKIYIMGGTNAISDKVASYLSKNYGTVIRLSGKDRFTTSKVVADEVSKLQTVKEIFVTTGDEKSSDPLAIAPYAGAKKIPILLTGKDQLNSNVEQFIREKNVSKVTIIGGTVAISSNVEKKLKALVGTQNVERVFGISRFDTNLEIIKKYYTENRDVSNSNSKLVLFNDLVIAQGMNTADALAAAPFASKINAPILLTLTEVVPTVTKNYLGRDISLRPDLYFLGGNVAISDGVRTQIKSLVK